MVAALRPPYRTPLSNSVIQSLDMGTGSDRLGGCVIDFQSRCLRDVDSQFGAEFSYVVREEYSIVAGARERNVGEPGIEQVRVNASVRVNEDAFGCKSLRAVTCDGIAVVEMRMLAGIELNVAITAKACCDAAIAMNRFDDG